MIVVRLLLLALVLSAVAPAPVAAATSGEPSVGLSNTGDLVDSCDGEFADPDEVTRPLEHVLAILSSARGFAAIVDPFTGEHVRLPFRPPIAG